MSNMNVMCRVDVVLGLVDLWGSQDYVREKTAEYLNNLISLGVAG